MTTCLGKSCSFGLLYVSFVNVINVFVCPSFSFGFEGGIRLYQFLIIGFPLTLSWIFL